MLQFFKLKIGAAGPGSADGGGGGISGAQADQSLYDALYGGALAVPAASGFRAEQQLIFSGLGGGGAPFGFVAAETA
eukprot:tig00021489_g21684.t1